MLNTLFSFSGPLLKIFNRPPASLVTPPRLPARKANDFNGLGGNGGLLPSGPRYLPENIRSLLFSENHPIFLSYFLQNLKIFLPIFTF